MVRRSTDKDWIDDRSPGRREIDVLCRLYAKRIDEMEKDIKLRLPTWVFKLFLSTTIPIGIALAGWIGYNAFETKEIVTRLDTNQRHLMEEFSIKPKSKPEVK